MLQMVRYGNRAATAACLLFLPVSVALAADGPGGLIQAGAETSNEAVEAIQAPAVSPSDLFLSSLPGASVVGADARREVPGVGPEDRPSILTDRGFGLPSVGPNAFEQQKLALARAAVESSRLAGTLDDPAEDVTIYTTEEQEAIKLQRLQSLAPVELPVDPVAGIGAFDPVQEKGPSGLNEIEVAKRDGQALPAVETTETTETTAPAVPATTPMESEAPSAQEEK